MGVPRIADLREPPVPGRYYLVPVIRSYPWHGRVSDWPVLGPLHEDADFFNFPTPHYHVDVRFLTARERRWAAARTPRLYSTGDVAGDVTLTASGHPLSHRGRDLPKGRPVLQRRRCSDVGTPTRLLRLMPESVRQAMTEKYGDPAQPIRRPDGRMLCPHRKVDLSQFVPDAAGVVVCPLHGLRVCVVRGTDGMPA